MSTGTELMAQPKKQSREKTADARTVIIHLKGSHEYAAWLEEVHRETHLPKATIVRLALTEWAAKNKRKTPPEF
jgi:hypothetical protein